MSAKRFNSAQVRREFWRDHPQFGRPTRRMHNKYNATIRSTFTEYVDALRRNDQITERVAQNVTL